MRSAVPPRRRLMLALLASASAGALALVLAACAGDSPAPTPTNTPTTDAPIFASDEEALAAAEEAYAAYNAANDQIGASGGEGVEILEPLVDSALFKQSKEEFEAFKDRGLRISGTTKFDGLRLMETSQHDSIAEVSAYVCRDVSSVRVIDAGGNDVTPSRTDRQALIGTFVSGTPGSLHLIVLNLQPWSGDGVC